MPPIGAVLLTDGRSEVVQMAERIAGSHHERWDGNDFTHGNWQAKQYRLRRVSWRLPMSSMRSHGRPYKQAWPIAEAVAEITRHRGTHFDPQLVDVFLSLPHADLI